MSKEMMSGMDLIEMISKMRKEERITAEELDILGKLVARYVYYFDKCEGIKKTVVREVERRMSPPKKDEWGKPGGYVSGN